jgi:disulfide oxidoreductase YuzD
MSISHVVSWYDLGNPISWAIYLSIAVEIFALASVSATTLNMNKNSVYFLFFIVTLIQMTGNIFFEYQYINIEGKGFKDWIELLNPVFTDWDPTSHRRFLAAVQGGTLPMMSLIALHFYIKFSDQLKAEKENEDTWKDVYTDENIKEIKQKRSKIEHEDEPIFGISYDDIDEINKDFQHADNEMIEKLENEEKVEPIIYKEAAAEQMPESVQNELYPGSIKEENEVNDIPKQLYPKIPDDEEEKVIPPKKKLSWTKGILKRLL